MLSLLYDIFISPLMVAMNFVLVHAYDALHSYGLAIVVLSLVVNTVLLPLYHMADKWQIEEREKQQKMANKVAEIKQAFKGQERFMMLKTLYRQNHYHPIMAVRNSVGFLIQVPFFFAAYQLLSHFPALHGQSFWIFNNLGVPDALIPLGSWHINLMPFVMTAINLLSAFVYTKGLSSKDKIQLYVFAGLFLVLLYNSPVGLVLYWTLNNVYSFFKNIFFYCFNNLTNKINSPYFVKIKKLYIHISSVLIAYLVITLILREFLPKGVTSIFLLSSARIYAFLPLIFFFSIICKVLLSNYNKFEKHREKIIVSDLMLVFIPFIPLVQYILSNSNILTLNDIVIFLLISFFLLILFIVILPVFLSNLVEKKTLQTAILLCLITVSYMPLISQQYNFSVGYINIETLFLFFVLFGLLSFYFVNFKNKNILYFVLFIFISNTISVLWVKYEKNDYKEETVTNKFNLKEFKKNYNVYLLTYDAYVSNQTMLEYGIDNTKQEKYLQTNGFTLYPNTYSIAASSIPTMARVLNVSSESSASELNKNTAGDANIFDEFKFNNYKTIGYFENTYNFWGADNKYDYSYPSQIKKTSPLILLTNSILSGYFRFDVGFDKFSRSDFLSNKYNFFNKIKENTPFFIYTHTGPGHSQNSGRCLNNETALFKARLDVANKEMKTDIETIEKNDPNAIIIINGDHGPYLTKNCIDLNKTYSSDEVSRLDLQDRYGTFLAIKLPNGDSINSSDITVLQDIFPAIFNYLSNSKYYNNSRVLSKTVEDVSSGVYIENGIIHGGMNDGERLFLGNHNEK